MAKEGALDRRLGLDPDLYVDTAALGGILSLSPIYLRQLRVKGGGPPFSKLSSKAVRYRVGDALAWAASKSVSSTSDHTTSGEGER